MSQPNKQNPHQVVLLLRYENCELDANGKICMPTKSDSKTYTFIGKDFQEAEDKVQEFLKRLEKDENDR